MMYCSRNFRSLLILTGCLLFTKTYAKQQKLENQQQSLPIVTASSLLPLTQDKLRLVSYAIFLSDIVYSDEIPAIQAVKSNFTKNIKYIDTGADAVLLVDIDSYCFVSYRGSNPPINLKRITIIDWLFQNFDFSQYTVTVRQSQQHQSTSTKSATGTENCSVQRGYYDAYAGVGSETVHKFIDKCMKPSKSTRIKKQLIFTGHSQGGAAALVGAIIDTRYKPLTITFGQPPAILTNTPCTLLNDDHIWRFINTENSKNGLQYDVVPFVEVFESPIFPIQVGKHVGAAIHLPPNNEGNNFPNPLQYNVVHRSKYDIDPYISKDDLDVKPDTMALLPFSSHLTSVYMDKINYILQQSRSSYSINVDGYVAGTKCHRSFECLGNVLNNNTHGCINNVCTDFDLNDPNLEIPCDDWQDCLSGRCDFTWYGKLICQPKKMKGSSCNENTDCVSNKCSWIFQCQ